MLDIAAACLVVTALLAYLNHRFVHLPTTIGVMVIALVLSLVIVALDVAGVSHALRAYEESLLRSIDFSDVLMQGMLSLLLFAGALHVDLSELKALRWPVASLALVGTLVSTLFVGLRALGRAALGGPGNAADACRLLKSVDEYQVEVLLTLAAVTGGCALARYWHISGPLAMVVTGLIIGNQGRALAMSDNTRRYLDMFRELLDEILNAVLFVLIGMEVLLISFSVPVVMFSILVQGLTIGRVVRAS